MRAVNRFLLDHNLRIAANPCISPDFCLDWRALVTTLRDDRHLKEWPKSGFETSAGAWTLVEDPTTGDCAWKLRIHSTNHSPPGLSEPVELGEGTLAYPATWDNLIHLKNAVQEYDASATIFPTTHANLG